MKHDPKQAGDGPFNITQVHEGDRYELSRGHAIYCAPTGGSGARANVSGAEVLDTDPDVESSGIDAGFALDDKTLRAPDVAIGNVPDTHGWIRAVPPLALEYAGSGQDEVELQEKIVQLLGAGTRYLWVVRLVGPRRVEVYEPGQPMRTVGPGQELTAPGVLRNAVPVEALFDRGAAHEVTLRNLLQRRGFASVEEVLARGRQEGRQEGERDALVRSIAAVCVSLDIPLTPERREALARMDLAALDAVLPALLERRRWD